MTDYPDHEEIAEDIEESIDFPVYLHSGHHLYIQSIANDTDYVPAYYRLDGAQGPVWYLNPESDEPIPCTMWDLVMEARGVDFGWIRKEETPWEDYDDSF